jgi:nucleoside phosphorylase
MTWGIAGAIEEEVRCIIDNLRQDSMSQWGRSLVHTGKIKNQDVVVMTTGQYLLDHFPVEVVIYTGNAGAKNPVLQTKIRRVISAGRCIRPVWMRQILSWR